MNASQEFSRPRRIGQVVGVVGIAVLTVLGATYVTNRLRKMRQTQQLLETLPAAIEARAEVPVEVRQAPDESQPVDTQDASDDVQPAATFEAADLEGKTVDELYKLARDRDIAGRSNMRKAELIAALQVIDETAS